MNLRPTSSVTPLVVSWFKLGPWEGTIKAGTWVVGGHTRDHRLACTPITQARGREPRVTAGHPSLQPELAPCPCGAFRVRRPQGP